MMREAPTLLRAEDDDGHVLLIQNGLRKAALENPWIRFCGGQEALDDLAPSRTFVLRAFTAAGGLVTERPDAENRRHQGPAPSPG